MLVVIFRKSSSEHALPLADETKILIHRDQYSPFIRSPLQNRSVSGIGPSVPRLDYIMTLYSQPVCQATSCTSVNKEVHLPLTCTASRESLAITAWAYARQALTSSGSRSG